MTVGELLARASSKELAEWQCYFRLEAEERRKAELRARAGSGRGAAKAQPPRG